MGRFWWLKQLKQSGPLVWALAFLGSAFVVSLLLLRAPWFSEGPWALSLAELGQAGDAMGPFASLFSFLALIAAIWSVNLQGRELALQRQDLALQRKELADNRVQLQRAADAQEAQVSALKEAAEMAKAQRLLLEDQAKAARMQAAALAWPTIHQFIWDLRKALEVLEHYLDIVQQRQGTNTSELWNVQAPVAPLILDLDGQQRGQRLAEDLIKARTALLRYFRDDGKDPKRIETITKEATYWVSQARQKLANYEEKVAADLRTMGPTHE